MLGKQTMAEGTEVGALAGQPTARLNPKSFHNWHCRIMVEIQMRGALSALETERPTSGESAIAAWNREDGKAKCLILRSLTDLQLPYVREAKTAKEMMTILTDTYAKTGVKDQFRLITELCHLKLERKEDCDKYCSKLTELFSDLALTNLVFSEDQKVAYLVGCLDESIFGGFASSVFGRERREYKVILQELRSYCAPFRQEELASGSGYKAEYKSHKRPITCFVCHKEGHMASQKNQGGGSIT